ncbi:MAG: hypothetical protein ACPGMZ_03885, partial [Candidatus Puniceispirillaceae bacterium]
RQERRIFRGAIPGRHPRQQPAQTPPPALGGAAQREPFPGWSLNLFDSFATAVSAQLKVKKYMPVRVDSFGSWQPNQHLLCTAKQSCHISKHM